jgi:type I restriction enzyme, S subunit
LCTQLHGLESGPSWSRLKDVSTETDGVPVVTPANITDEGTISHTRLRRLASKDAEAFRRFALTEGDIVCVRQGTLGRQAVAGPAEDGWLFGAACVRIRLAPDSPVGPDYVVRYMNRARIRTWLFAQASGQTVPTITVSRLATLPVVAPPWDVQRDLCAKVDALDVQIRRHTRAQALLDELRASLIEQAVTPLGRLESR